MIYPVESVIHPLNNWGQDVERDDNVSVYSKSSSASRSSRKKSLKRVLVSKRKLDLARARAREEAEAVRLAYEHKQRMELRHLEEEASLAELEWKIATEYNDEGGLTPRAASLLDATTFLVDRRPHSTRSLRRKLRPADLTLIQVPLLLSVRRPYPN